MMGEKLVTIAVAIGGVATLAVLVSKNADTSKVIGAGGKAFADAINAAVSPVTNSGGNGFVPHM